jgi:hypothetical protein
MGSAVATRLLDAGYELGFGETVKAVANLLLIGQLSVLAEVVVTAQANGVSDDLLATLGRLPLVPPALQPLTRSAAAGAAVRHAIAAAGLRSPRRSGVSVPWIGVSRRGFPRAELRLASGGH